MTRRRPDCRRLVLACLTLWLGLWPAADAVTGVSQVVIVEPATETEGRRCPLPDAIIEQAASSGCCAMEPVSESGDSDCCESKQSRCCRCYTLGGMVLFAVAQWTLDANHAEWGTVPANGVIGPSRHLQPPVPPPLSLS